MTAVRIRIDHESPASKKACITKLGFDRAAAQAPRPRAILTLSSPKVRRAGPIWSGPAPVGGKAAKVLREAVIRSNGPRCRPTDALVRC